MKCETSNVKRENKWTVPMAVLVCAVAYGWCPSAILAEDQLVAPTNLQAFDTPNDGGESLTIQWAPS
ncbi:MAG: hypothetical protein AABY94_03545, partial [Nitrospirota bacterium]